jgi:hypothetical protein
MAIKPIHKEAYKLGFIQTKKMKVRGYAKLYVEHQKKQGINANEVQANNVMRGIVQDYQKLNVIRVISGLEELREGQMPTNELQSSEIANSYNFQSQKLA